MTNIFQLLLAIFDIGVEVFHAHKRIIAMRKSAAEKRMHYVFQKLKLSKTYKPKR